MAFYKDVKGKTRREKQAVAQNRGGFDDEGSHYTGKYSFGKAGGSRNGEGKRYHDGSRSDERRFDGERKSYGDHRNNDRKPYGGDHRSESGKRYGSARPGQERRFDGDRREGRKFSPKPQQGEYRFSKNAPRYEERGSNVTPASYDEQRKARRSGEEFRASFGALNGFVLDSLRGVRESLQYGDGPHRLAQINARTDKLSSQERRLKLAGGTAQAVTGGIILLLDAGMLALAAGLAQSGTIGFDGCLIAVVALMSSFGPVIALANLGTGLQNTFAAGNRVLDVLDEQPTVREVTGGEDIAFTGAACRRVTFGYGSDVILNDVSLEVPQNSVIGITGRSGSGKSTLLKLMMRFWDTDLGKVELSGVNIKKINTASLRSAESFVEQDTVLFHDSIEENLRIANQNATHEQVVGACKKASIHDFIMTLPQGYDTPVGELGSTLSGGERQRLGVARAFLHDAPYILLDEPTSNLDSLNEAVILKSLAEERKDKTVVLVSHRASTMRIADRTYSVENGRMS